MEFLLAFFPAFFIVTTLYVTFYYGYLKPKLQRQHAEEVRRVSIASVKKSKEVVKGIVTENLVPHFPDFPFNPADVHFLANPIDYLVYVGDSQGEIEEIVFLEIKSGQAQLSTKQRRIRNLIKDGKVRFELYRARSDDSDTDEL